LITTLHRSKKVFPVFSTKEKKCQKHLGVIKDGVKYRLATLGVLDTCKEKLKDFERVKSKVKELEKIQSKVSTRKQKTIDKSR